MLSNIIRWSLHHRLVVVLVWLGIAAAGVVSFERLPMDAFPDTTPVQVQINTAAAALSPLEVERQITMRIEQSIGGLPGLAEVRSVSRFGFSQVTVIFAEGTDIYLARQVVSERLQAVSLSSGIERPTLGPVATGLGEVFHFLVSGEGKSLTELRTTQDWIIKPQLRSVPGVAEVNGWGGDERQIQVVVDPLQLANRGLTLEQLANALEKNNANVGGGTIDRAGESELVQGMAYVTTARDVEEMVVAAHDGVPVYVRDVAKVVDGREIRRAAVTADGKGEVVLGLGFMLMGENSHDVAARLRLRLADIEKSLPPGVKVTTVYDRTDLVDHVLRTVRNNLLEGALLVVAVLFVFLGSARSGLVVAAAIPLSMLCASSLMLKFGIAGSLMSLGAIDFGLVVDSSVIMVENASHHLSVDETERPILDVVRDAALEVRGPTMFGELVIMIVYLPILTLEGVEGKLFRPMALTVIFALLGSMLLSLTLMPVLTSLFLKRTRHAPQPWLTRTLVPRYRKLVELVLRRRWFVVAGAVLLLGNAAFLATRLGSEFVPRLREGTLVVNTVRAAGVSVDETIRVGLQVERLLLAKFPDEIDHVWTRSGAPEVTTDPMGLELSDVFITLTPVEKWKRAHTQDELSAAIRKELEVFPGMRAISTQPIEMRVNEMIAGVRADVGVKLFGEDFDVLKEHAAQIETILKSIPGATDVSTEQVTGRPVLQVEVDRIALGRHGIAARAVLDVVESLGTRVVGELKENERRFPITLRLHDKYRTDMEALGTVLVTAANGDRIPLRQLAKLSIVEGPAAINREWARRRVTIQVNVRDRDVGSYVNEANERINREVQLPPGYYVRFGGQFEHLERAQQRLLIVVPAALVLILVLLYFTYGRLVDALRVFIGVPFAAIGGIFGLWLRDIPFSVSAAVGFVALSGVAVLGDMVLVSTVRQLITEGVPLHEAVLRAAERRLRPVLMTALVAGLGFVPMALNTGIGAEVQKPLATVVIAGIISSTILTLIVLPAIFELFGAPRPLPAKAQASEATSDLAPAGGTE